MQVHLRGYTEKGGGLEIVLVRQQWWYDVGGGSATMVVRLADGGQIERKRDGIIKSEKVGGQISNRQEWVDSFFFFYYYYYLEKW